MDRNTEYGNHVVKRIDNLIAGIEMELWKRQCVQDFRQDLAKLGLYEEKFEKGLKHLLDDRNSPQRFLLQRFMNGTQYTFELYPDVLNDRLDLQNYSLLIPASPHEPYHRPTNGLDTRELEERMGRFDWHRHDGGYPGNIAGITAAERLEMEGVLRDLETVARQGSSGTRDDSIYRQLVCKYLAGTPVENAIIEKMPYRQLDFYDDFTFPNYLHYKVIRNALDSPYELSQLSERAFMSGYTKYTELLNKPFIMNINNVEDRKEDLRNLGFSEKTVARFEELAKKDVPRFRLHESEPANKFGQIEYAVPVKRSGQSDFYYIDKFEVLHNKFKKLNEEEKFMVITPSPNEDGKNLVKKLDSMTEAIDYFKKLQGNSELALGKDARSKTTLAKMQDGKVNYVERKFYPTFRQPPIPQTFYLDEGQGFTKQQAGAMMQGMPVHRDDMVNGQGMPYKAWVALNFEKPRDRYNNYPLRQFHDPKYGFDLKEQLSWYNIKDMETPERANKIEETIRNGGRPLVTAQNEQGEAAKVYVEAAVRWVNLNFTREDGKPLKREEFLKPEIKEKLNVERNLEKSNEQRQERGARVGM